jgi:hypothetical protein
MSSTYLDVYRGGDAASTRMGAEAAAIEIEEEESLLVLGGGH